MILSSNNFREKVPLSVKLAESGTLSQKWLELKIVQTMKEKEVVTVSPLMEVPNFNIYISCCKITSNSSN